MKNKNIKNMEIFSIYSQSVAIVIVTIGENWNSLFSIVLIAMHIIYVIFYAIQYANICKNNLNNLNKKSAPGGN